MRQVPRQSVSARPLLSPSDRTPRFVRFGRLTDQGSVEFSFGVGSADLMAELILPLEAYRSFCQSNQVVHLTRDEEDQQDYERSKWRYGSPGLTE